MASADTVGAEIRAQHFRNDDRAVRLLIVLEQRGDRAWEPEPGAVQRVNKLGFLPTSWSVANIRPSRLKVRERTARGDFQPFSDAGRPDFEIVRLRRSEPGIARREQHDAVRQAKSLQYALGMRREQLMLRRRILRRTHSHQLDLVELVYPEQAAGVLPRCPGLAPKARRISDQSNRQLGAIEDLIA